MWPTWMDVTARATGIERGDLGGSPREMSVQQVTGLSGAVGIEFLDGKREDGQVARRGDGEVARRVKCQHVSPSVTKVH